MHKSAVGNAQIISKWIWIWILVFKGTTPFGSRSQFSRIEFHGRLFNLSGEPPKHDVNNSKFIAFEERHKLSLNLQIKRDISSGGCRLSGGALAGRKQVLDSSTATNFELVAKFVMLWFFESRIHFLAMISQVLDSSTATHFYLLRNASKNHKLA